MSPLQKKDVDKMGGAKENAVTEKHVSHSDLDFIRQRKLARQLAMQCLFSMDTNSDWQWDEGNFAITALTASLIEDDDNDTPLRSDFEAAKQFAQRIAKGAAEHVSEIDMAIECAAKNWTVARMSKIDKAILRIAAYELMFEAKIPAATSINEAVELAKAFGEAKSPRFINGVLDKIRENCGKASKKSPKGNK